jgi:hypothetical protein
MGIDASRSANSNRSKQQERRRGFRNILCENLERREVMAGDILDLDFRLLSVAPNTGEILSTTRSNTLNESPRELIFRFAGGDDVRQSTLRNGIRLTRAGGDGVFGAGGVSTDIIVTPEYLDFADVANRRVVVARFSQPLPDDLYNVEVFGVDLPAQGINAVRNVVNDPLKPRKTGTDRDSYVFNLELGSKITAIVPQPINSTQSESTSTTANFTIERSPLAIWLQMPIRQLSILVSTTLSPQAIRSAPSMIAFSTLSKLPSIRQPRWLRCSSQGRSTLWPGVEPTACALDPILRSPR